MPSLRDGSDWTGIRWRLPGTGPGALNLTGNIDAAGPKLRLTNAALSLDDIHATGQIGLDTGGARPLVEGLVDMDRLDLDTYLPDGPGPRLQSATWDDQPFDFSGLALADADVSLSMAQVYFRGLRLGRSVVDLHLHDRKLNLDLNRVALYDGFGKGAIQIADDGAKTAYQAHFNLADIQLQPMLKDLAGFDRLSGIGTIDLNLTSTGHSNREIVAHLDGTGSIAVNNGSMRGLNLETLLRTPTETPAALGRPGDSTMLTGGTTNLAIADGVVRSRDLSLRLPDATVSGGGQADLPRRQLHLDLAAHGLAGATSGIIEGQWSHLTYRSAAAPMPGRLVAHAKPRPRPNGPLHFLRRLFGGE
jgi:AsmA protein